VEHQVEKDIFRGEESVRNFSARLAIEAGSDLTDSEIGSILGPEAVGPFRYAQSSLTGCVRKTTGEPAFCHSADIALRAVDLGYGQPVVALALLHDTIEDRSGTLADVSDHLLEIKKLFGQSVGEDIRLSTNVYSIILRAMEGRVPKSLPFEPESRRVVAQALLDYREELPGELARQFQRELERLLSYFLPLVDVSSGAAKARIDKKYTLVSELRLQSYRLFVEDIVDDARYRYRPEGSGFHEVPLTVKALDLIDNLRTSEVANFASMERILLKVETFLDCSFFLHDVIRKHNHQQATYISLYDYVKYHLIEQMMERKRAMVFLADTRFAFFAQYLVREITRLQEKYKVSNEPVQELARLRDEIRRINLGQ